MGLVPLRPPHPNIKKRIELNRRDAKIRDTTALATVTVALIAIIVLFSVLECTAEAGATRYEQELTDYLSDYLEIYPKRKAAALKYIPVVIEASVYERIDPMLIATVISFESSWRAGIVNKSIPKTRGLMQVHGVAAKGFDLRSVDGQVKAGAKHLGVCLDKCEGDVGKALGCYQTSGFCNGNLWSARKRLKVYKANVKKYRRVRR